MAARRYDYEAAPFRVLSPAGGRLQYEPQPVLRSPPPPRAPEPYKVAPQATSYGSRSLRKSSFAILAETRPPSPGNRAESPSSQQQQQLQQHEPPPSSGRLSPFRGRGFKGPPPRARSTPQSPQSTRRNRAGSNSQQGSPRRSQIPRPARSRSISASKDRADSRKASPKFGRRAANRYAASIASNNATHRRLLVSRADSKQASELSPIQGTPTRSLANDKNGVAGKGGFGALKSSDAGNLGRNRLLPPKNTLTGQKRFITAKTTTPSSNAKLLGSSETLDSPTKIPRRRDSLVNDKEAAGLTNKQNRADGKQRLGNDKAAKQLASRNKSKLNLDESDVETFKVISSKGDDLARRQAKDEGQRKEDSSLAELLKQSSGVADTSSVVSTTTTTAVQPLKIDAASILAEGELVAKLTTLERKQKLDAAAAAADEKSAAAVDKAASEQKLPDVPESNSSNSSSSKPAAESNSKVSAKNANNSTQTMIKHFGPNSSSAETGGKSSSSDARLSNPLNPGNATSNRVTPLPSAVATELLHNASDINGKSSTPVNPEKEVEQQQQQRQATDKKEESAAAKSSTDNASSNNNNNNNNSTAKPAATTKVDSPKVRLKGATEARGGGSNGEAASPRSQARVASSSESLAGSVRSADTGVSVNTVRGGGVSSAKEKSGLHVVKRTEQIETLSANVVSELDRNGEHAVAGADPAPETRWQKFRSRCLKRLGRGSGVGRPKLGGGGSSNDWWPKMRCLACKRDPKAAKMWPGKKPRTSSSTMQLTEPADKSTTSRWARLKDACRCAKLREVRRPQQRRQQQVAPLELGGSRKASCCPAPERRFGQFCRDLASRCNCSSWMCNRRKRRRQSDQSQHHQRPPTKPVKSKHSLSSVTAPPVSEETRPKIPDVLVEHNSLMRGAIPCLPLPIAWFCLIWNVVLPGSGTILSGLFNLCVGQPRFSAVASPKARFGALIVNIVVGISQLFTVLFCLVGWGWSIWWGVTMVRLGNKYKRFKESEATANDPEARAGPETATLPTPGIPAQALRPAERLR